MNEVDCEIRLSHDTGPVDKASYSLIMCDSITNEHNKYEFGARRIVCRL